MQLFEREQPTVRWGSWPLRLASLCLCLLPALSGAEAAPADSTRAPHGSWGPLPEPADSVTARFDAPSLPAWEWPGRVVYKVVGYPLRAVKYVTKQTVVHTYESGLGPRLIRLPGPYGSYNLTFSASAGPDGIDLGASVKKPEFFGTGGRFRASGLWTTREAGKLSAGFASADERLTLGGRYSRRPEARFFGLGAGSVESTESFYVQEQTWGGVGWRQPIGRDWDVRLTTLYSEVEARGPGPLEANDDDRDLLAVHPSPPGYGERSRGATLRLGLLHDSTREQGRPERGGIELAEAARFVETGDAGPDFWILRGELQRFVPLPNSKQVLAARSYLSWIAADDLGAVPFQRLLTNDEPDQFRGFRDSRWRDRGIVGLTVEYRWPFWALATADGPGADLALFSDIGQVFREFEEIGDSNLTQSYGVGLRFVGLGGYAGRLEVAWSEEEWTVRLKGDQLFHLARRGVYDGRDQVAVR